MYPGRHKCIQGDISVSRATKVYPGRCKCIQGAWKHIYSDWMLLLRGFAEIPAYRHPFWWPKMWWKRIVLKRTFVYLIFFSLQKKIQISRPNFCDSMLWSFIFMQKTLLERSCRDTRIPTPFWRPRMKWEKIALKRTSYFQFFSSLHKKFQVSRTNFRLSSLKG